jgi:ABC-type multidrug transport system ATPase subunit
MNRSTAMSESSQQSTGFSLNVNELSKRFNREWIFKNLTQKFTGGNIYAIKGSNGAGKSTLLQVLSGHIPPTSGTIEYIFSDNQVISTENFYRHISIAAPYMDLIEEFTLAEHLDFHFKLKPIREGVTQNDLLDIMYLKHAQDKFISNFSSGMKQRLKLAMAFYSRASILFLDEPGTNLDQQAFDWYRDQLSKIPSNSLVFIASNNSAEYPYGCMNFNIEDYKTKYNQA